MRFLLALILMVPGFAQQPETSPKPDDSAAQAGAKAGAKPAENLVPTPITAIQTPAAAAAAAAPSADQWLTGSIDFGYRWVTGIGGSVPEYRSVVNLGEGPKLFGLDFTVLDPKKRLFDRLDARAYNWGGDPYNTAHINAIKRQIYDFSFDYQNIAYFNAVPSFANPLSPSGFDQQSFDTHRRNTTVLLDLFPGGRIQPYVAFYRNYGYGTGIDDFVQGANNSYPVPVSLHDATNSYRAGVRFEANKYHATVEVGGTTFKEDDQSNYTDQNFGNRTTPVLGQQQVLNSLQQAYGIRGNSIYTRGLLTANLTSRVSFYGQFLYSQPTTDVTYSELAGGAFANVPALLLFGGQFGTATGFAIQPHVSGNAGVEVHATNRLRITESVSTDRQHDSGFGLFNQALFQNLSSNPGLISSNSVAQNTLQVVNLTTVETNLFYDVSSKLTVRGGYRYATGNAEVPASTLSQIGPFESGNLRRNIALAGATYRAMQKLTLNAEYEGGSSDQIYFRNSLNNYSRGRVRARYQAHNSLTLQMNFQILNNQNPSQDIRFDFLSLHATAGVYWTPNSAKRITVSAEYDRAWVNSDILYLNLPFFTPSTSSYTENAHTGTAVVDVALPRLSGGKVTAGGSFVHLTGSRPTNFYEPLARISIPVVKHVYWNTEWRYYGFSEAFYLFEGFRANTFTTGLRVTR
jgi:hypothetical protein